MTVTLMLFLSQHRRLRAMGLPRSKTKHHHHRDPSVRPFLPIPIEVDKDYNGSISGGEIILYRVDYLKQANESEALRIKLSSDHSKKVRDSRVSSHRRFLSPSSFYFFTDTCIDIDYIKGEWVKRESIGGIRMETVMSTIDVAGGGKLKTF